MENGIMMAHKIYMKIYSQNIISPNTIARHLKLHNRINFKFETKQFHIKTPH